MGPWRAMLGRELLESSRRPRTWTLRWVAGAVGVAALAVILWIEGTGIITGRFGPGGSGRAMFGAIGGLSGLWALFVGCQKTADSLGKERRDGTLGLLFLTDMKGWDVVLGKLGGAGVDSFFQLAAVVPVLMVPMLLGGVSAGQVGWLVAGLTGALVLSLAAGLLASLAARDPRQATGLAVVGLLGLLLVPFALFLFLLSLDRPFTPDDAKWVLIPCPAVPFATALGGGGVGLNEGPLTMAALACQAWISWRVLSWTARWVRTAWREGGPRTWRTRWIDGVNRLRFGGPEARARWRRRWLATGAWEWLSLRERWKPLLPWILVVVAYGLWAANIAQLGWRSVAGTATGVLALLFHGLFALWVAGEAGITLHEQRVAGAMELLQTSGMGPSDILRGQGRVLRTMLLGPVLAVTLLDGVVLAWVPFMDGPWSEVALGWWTHLACAAWTPFTWAGMRWATTLAILEGKPINTAVVRALAWCVAWPGLLVYGPTCLFLVSQASSGDVSTTSVTLAGILSTSVLAAWSGLGARRWRDRAKALFVADTGSMAGARKDP